MRSASGRIRIQVPGLLLLWLLLWCAPGAGADPPGPTNEVRRGAEAFRLLVEERGITTDTGLEQQVETLGEKIVAASAERTYLRFHFAVINDSRINAAALPGGYIYLTQGLCDAIRGFAAKDPVRVERMLAAALAHEIAHVMRRHHLERFSSLEEVLSLDQVEVGAMLAISRDNEFEADQYGGFFMLLAGFELTGMDDLLALLDTLHSQDQDTIHSTHPGPPDRRQAMAAYREQLATIVDYFHQAQALLAMGRDTNLALRCLEEWVLPNFPSYHQVHHALGVGYLRKYLDSRPREAMICQPAFSFYDFDPPLGQPRGEAPTRYLELAAGELEGVLDQFSTTSPPYQGVEPTLSAYTQVLVEQNRLERAAEFAHRALALEPNSWAALNNLGVVYYRQANPARAVDCFNQALLARGRSTVEGLSSGKLEPAGTYAPLLYNLGLAANAIGDRATAARVWSYYRLLDSSSFWADRIRKTQGMPASATDGSTGTPAPGSGNQDVGTSMAPAFEWHGPGNPFLVGFDRERVEKEWGPVERVQDGEGHPRLCYPSRNLEFQLDSQGMVALVGFLPGSPITVAGIAPGAAAKDLANRLPPLATLKVAVQVYLDYSPRGMMVETDPGGKIARVMVISADADPPQAGKIDVVAGIRLNDQPEVVEEILGAPTRTIDDPASGQSSWVYEQLGLTVNLQAERVESLLLAPPSQERVGEVGLGDSFTKVRGLLGAPNLAEDLEDGSRRLIYQRRGLILKLTQDTVSLIMVH